MKFRESAEQKILVRWFKLQYPQYKHNLYYIDNGGRRSPYLAQIKKDMGELPGIPDIAIAVPNAQSHGLFIEMKYGTNKLSPKQIEVQEALRLQGYQVNTCWSADEAIQAVKDYFGSSRG